MKYRPRRIITRVIVFLLAGAIINVTVAWALAGWVDGIPPELFIKFQESVSAAEDDAWIIMQWDNVGTTIVFAKAARYRATARYRMTALPPPDADAAEIGGWQEGWGWRLDPALKVRAAPYWSQAPERPSAAEPWTDYHHDARGWPVLTLVGYETFQRGRGKLRNTPGNVCWAIDLGTWQGPAGLPRRLPLRPIWPGFAINTVFYAAVLGAMFLGPGMVRRALRQRRGLCPACGYPVGVSPTCTECGAAIVQRIRSKSCIDVAQSSGW